MGEFSIFHWLVVLAIILIFFGGRRIPEVMKGLGEGIRSFKEGVSGAEKAQTPSATLAAPGGLTAPAAVAYEQTLAEVLEATEEALKMAL